MPLPRELLDLLRLLARGEPIEPPLTAIPPVSEEQQEMRQTATITIAHLLQSLGRGRWVPPVLRWLARYDGLEGLLYPADDPFVKTAAALGALVQQRAAEHTSEPVTSDAIASILVAQSFCANIRVRAGFAEHDKEWDSTVEAFGEYLDSIKPTIIPNVWEVNYSTPSSAAHRRLLMMELDQT